MGNKIFGRIKAMLQDIKMWLTLRALYEWELQDSVHHVELYREGLRPFVLRSMFLITTSRARLWKFVLPLSIRRKVHLHKFGNAETNILKIRQKEQQLENYLDRALEKKLIYSNQTNEAVRITSDIGTNFISYFGFAEYLFKTYRLLWTIVLIPLIYKISMVVIANLK